VIRTRDWPASQINNQKRQINSREHMCPVVTDWVTWAADSINRSGLVTMRKNEFAYGKYSEQFLAEVDHG
jgi:hypothetical protein